MVAFGIAVMWLKFLLLDIVTYKNDIYVWIYENNVNERDEPNTLIS